LEYATAILILGLLIKSVMIDNTAIRKVQAYTGEKSLTIVLPRNFTVELGIEKGDFLKVHVEDKQLILEKAEI
jgi:antitoxin component of MazEF toxin-antitoxin module